MAHERRKLAAIVVADVVGYSRLMGRDEAGTLARLKEHRSERLQPALARNSGRLLKLTGDGALAEFGSAVDALRAAVEFQQAVAYANTGQPEEQRIVFRVGLHLGDMIVDGDDLYGDGVNIAARLEAEAPPGGIVISRTVHEAVAGRIKATFDDLGSITLKNIERPVQAFSVSWNPSDWQTPLPSEATAAFAAEPSSLLALPDKPSIAVLPFQNMSGDPDQEYFADGVTEDIITALSRAKALFVIARNSTFTYKGKSVDIKQVGRELGVRYLLEGSVRKARNRLRITGQLIDATTGSHLWADRFEGGVEDLFDLQDEVTSRVVGAIEPELEQAEIERARRKPTRDLRAYDYYLRGMARFYAQSKGPCDEALALFHQANHLDASFALPFAQASLCYVQRKAFGWATDHDQDIAEADRLARLALELDRKHPRVLANAGYALAYVCGHLEEGADLIDQAVDLDPNYAIGWTWRAMTKGWLGSGKSAIEDYERTLRLSPLDPLAFLAQNGLAWAHFIEGRHGDALAWAEKSLHLRPHHLPTLRTYMASLALVGRVADARKAFEAYRRLDPAVRILSIRAGLPTRSYKDAERLAAGLRLAGMPE